MSAEQWYRLLNGYVFFWPTEARLTTLLNARAYRGREHDVITIDTRRLLQRHSDAIVLSPINSGSTIYQPPRRGRETFRTVADYPYEEHRRRRGRAGAIAELAVLHSVPNIEELATRVVRRQGDRVSAVLFEEAPQLGR
jgi:hypothetical protein